MSKYTTEVRFICEVNSGLKESQGYSGIKDIIEQARPKIFNFDYPMFDASYKAVLETKILRHYYTREICEETVGLWKLRLETKLNEIMPYYNKLYQSELLEFNPMYTHNLTREHDTVVDNTGNSTGTIDSTINGASSGTNSTKSSELYSDTPQGSIQNLEDKSYLTNATINDDLATTGSTSSNTSAIASGEQKAEKSIENYLEKVVGFDGANPSKMLKDFRSTFLNIDLMILKAVEDLFFGLW